MRNIREYMGKNAVALDHAAAAYTVAVADSYFSTQAKSLQNVYNALPDVEPAYGSTMLVYFVQLAAKFAAYREAGVQVKSTTYMAAHRWWYGENLQPWYLLSPESFKVCQAYQEQSSIEEVQLDATATEAYYGSTVERLAKLRGETVEQTRQALVDAGLV